MKQYLPFIIGLILFSFSYGQSIPDNTFTWSIVKQCPREITNAETFVKVEISPVITQFSRIEFENFVNHSLDKFTRDKNKSGILKLKLLFIAGQSLCLDAVGSKELILNEQEIRQLKEAFQTITEFKAGKQRSKIVNCMGILYIFIESGQVTKIRHVNFHFDK